MEKRTLTLELSYDGTGYAGWQRQDNAISVQHFVEKAVSTVANETVSVMASGRTDAGVHARKQVVSFTLHQSRTPDQAFVQGVNCLLPRDIRVQKVERVEGEFCANRSAVSKMYRYHFQFRKLPNVFTQRYVWQTPIEYDLERMKKASQFFIGTHDFVSFAPYNLETKTTIREIYSVEFLKDLDGADCMQIHGSGFLRHMVRTMMGTLMEVGVGKREPDCIESILQAKDRIHAGHTCPPHGLFLWDVFYD